MENNTAAMRSKNWKKKKHVYCHHLPKRKKWSLSACFKK